MIKQFFTAVVLLATSTGAVSAQDVLDAIAEEACSCSREGGVSMANPEEFQMQLGLCILQACTPREKELKKQYSFTLSDFAENEKKAEEFGMQVGMRMAFKCPELFAGTEATAMDEEWEEEVVEDPMSYFVEGVLTAIEPGQFNTLLVRDDGGEVHRVLWLTFFENSELFATTAKVGSRITVEFYEDMFYNPSVNDYEWQKVIVGVTPN